MKRRILVFLFAVVLGLLGYAVYSATNHDISLNEPAPFPENI